MRRHYAKVVGFKDALQEMYLALLLKSHGNKEKLATWHNT
jgi:hypothetical protein